MFILSLTEPRPEEALSAARDRLAMPPASAYSRKWCRYRKIAYTGVSTRPMWQAAIDFSGTHHDGDISDHGTPSPLSETAYIKVVTEADQGSVTTAR